MNNDLISREALRNVILNDRKLDGANANWEVNRILVHIDNAPTVEAFTKEDMAGAYNEGYACGSRENERPQGEWIDCREDGFVECPFCKAATTCEYDGEDLYYCYSCGANLKMPKTENEEGGAEND